MDDEIPVRIVYIDHLMNFEVKCISTVYLLLLEISFKLSVTNLQKVCDEVE